MLTRVAQIITAAHRDL